MQTGGAFFLLVIGAWAPGRGWLRGRVCRCAFVEIPRRDAEPLDAQWRNKCTAASGQARLLEVAGDFARLLLIEATGADCPRSQPRPGTLTAPTDATHYTKAHQSRPQQATPRPAMP